MVTVPDLEGLGDMYLADFKDSQALAFKKTNHFLGLSRNRGIRLGRHPLRMIDGVWYITEDPEAKMAIQDLQISHEALCLRIIR